jgi:ankyrin repeat protein
LKGRRKNDPRALEEKIRREIQRRVFEESEKRKKKNENAENERIEINALAEVSELPAQAVTRISREVRAEFKSSAANPKPRIFASRWIFVLAIVAVGVIAAVIVGIRAAGKTSKGNGVQSGEQYDALIKAVEEGNSTMAAYLLDRGAPLQSPTDSGFSYHSSALMTAAAMDQVGLVKLLLAHGADVAYRGKASGWTALDFADDQNNQALVDILGKAVADDSAENSPLQELWRRGIPFSRAAFVDRAKQNDLQAVRLFLAAGMNVNAEGRSATHDDDTALSQAAQAGLAEMARIIITEAPQDNRPLMKKPLSYAVREDHLDIVRILLKAGADPNAVLIYDALPYPQIASLLLDYGININAGIGNDQVPALVAVLDTWYTAVDGSTRKRWVRFLLDHGADPRMRGGGLKTALDLAKAWGDPEVIGWITEAVNSR